MTAPANSQCLESMQMALCFFSCLQMELGMFCILPRIICLYHVSCRL